MLIGEWLVCMVDTIDFKQNWLNDELQKSFNESH